jgi:hypothetical protein
VIRTAAEQFQYLEFQVGRIAKGWRIDANAAVEIEARLRRHGFGDIVVNAEGFSQARRSFPYSTISCTRHKTDAWYCSGQSTSAANWRNAPKGRQMRQVMENSCGFRKPLGPTNSFKTDKRKISCLSRGDARH